jgi:hypothetical protein
MFDGKSLNMDDFSFWRSINDAYFRRTPRSTEENDVSRVGSLLPAIFRLEFLEVCQVMAVYEVGRIKMAE